MAKFGTLIGFVFLRILRKLLMTATFCSVQVFAQVFVVVDESSFVAPIPSQDDFLGSAAAIDGDYAAVSAYGNDGFVIILKKTGSVWAQEAVIQVSPGGNHFGYSAALSGDTLVVGKRLDDVFGGNTGSAYVFRRSGTTWSQETQLFADNTGHASLAEFGRDVDIDGDTIVVSNPRDDDQGFESGSAYVFTRSGTVWSQQAKLTGSSVVTDDEFGNSVSISGDRIVVGAVLGDGVAADTGTAYVFLRTGTSWAEEAILQASDSASGDQYGTAVDINGDSIIVGAWRHNGERGAAYVYERSGSTWPLSGKLAASDGQPLDLFGGGSRGVAIDGILAVSGSLFHADDGLTNSGSVYVYRKDGGQWTEIKEIKASDAGSESWLGTSVEIQGTTVVAGAYEKEVSGQTGAGAGYIFELTIQENTAVDLLEFSTTVGSASNVIVEWVTGVEIETAGFNILRVADGGFDEYSPAVVNSQLIPAKGGLVGTENYRFVDTPGYGRFLYQLEDVESNGARFRHEADFVEVLPEIAVERSLSGQLGLRHTNLPGWDHRIESGGIDAEGRLEWSPLPGAPHNSGNILFDLDLEETASRLFRVIADKQD